MTLRGCDVCPRRERFCQGSGSCAVASTFSSGRFAFDGPAPARPPGGGAVGLGVVRDGANRTGGTHIEDHAECAARAMLPPSELAGVCLAEKSGRAAGGKPNQRRSINHRFRGSALSTHFGPHRQGGPEPARLPMGVGTRSGQEPKSRRSGGTPDAEMTVSNDIFAPPSPAPVVQPAAPASNGTPIVLMVTGHWNPPPSIGEIEAVLKSSGRTQHRIMRIEVRADCAFVEVHPDDVAHCTGMLELGGLQVSGRRRAPRLPRAPPVVCPRREHTTAAATASVARGAPCSPRLLTLAVCACPRHAAAKSGHRR